MELPAELDRCLEAAPPLPFAFLGKVFLVRRRNVLWAEGVFGDVPGELRNARVQSCRQPCDGFQGGVRLTALNFADVRHVNVCQIRQVFLAELPRKPRLPQATPERGGRKMRPRRFHPYMLIDATLANHRRTNLRYKSADRARGLRPRFAQLRAPPRAGNRTLSVPIGLGHEIWCGEPLPRHAEAVLRIKNLFSLGICG